MDKMNKEIIREDLDFIHEYLCTLLSEHPELAFTDSDIFRKIERRMNDIDKRLDA